MFSCFKCCIFVIFNVLFKESFYIVKDLIFIVFFGVMDLFWFIFIFCRYMWVFKVVKMFFIIFYILVFKFEVFI